MFWGDRVFNYCERGVDPAFWAEPANAVSNGAFLVAAAVAGVELARARDDRALPEWVLIALVSSIGVGSFLFHTYATRWAVVADVLPITMFMLAYFGYALHRLVGLHWLIALAAVAGFMWTIQEARAINCRPWLFWPPTAGFGTNRCMNGTAGYSPALIAMLLTGAILAVQRHPATVYLVSAAVIFALAMLLRTVDREVCGSTLVAGRLWGTHFLWHTFNAVTVWLLLAAAIRHGRPRPRQSEA